MSSYSFGGGSGYPGLQDFFDQQNQYRPMAKKWGDEDAAANVNRLQGLNTAFGRQIGLNGQLGSKQLLRLAQAQDIYGGIGVGGGSGSRSGGMSSGGLPPTEDIYQQRARIAGLEAQTAASNAERDRINREQSAYGLTNNPASSPAPLWSPSLPKGEGQQASPVGPDQTTAARAANAVNQKRINDASYMNDPKYIAAGKAQLHKSTLTPLSMLGSVGQRWSNPDGGVTQSGGTKIQYSPTNRSQSEPTSQPAQQSALPSEYAPVNISGANEKAVSDKGFWDTLAGYQNIMGRGPQSALPATPATPTAPGATPATPATPGATPPPTATPATQGETPAATALPVPPVVPVVEPEKPKQ